MQQRQLSSSLPGARLPPELLGRIAHFSSFPSDHLLKYTREWRAAHRTLCTLALVNRAFAAFARPLAWRQVVLDGKDSDGSQVAHIFHTESLHPFVQELAWRSNGFYDSSSPVGLPLLSAMTSFSFSFSPFDRGRHEVPTGITKLLSAMKSLRRLELGVCREWADQTFSLGREVPSLRQFIIDNLWNEDEVEYQQLGQLEHLSCPLVYWAECALGPISARQASLATLRELDLDCRMARVADFDTLDDCARLVSEYSVAEPAPPPIRLEALTLHLTFSHDPNPMIDVLQAFESASSLRKISLMQSPFIAELQPEPWARLKLLQVRELSLIVHRFDATLETDKTLCLSAILSSFPNLTMFTLVSDTPVANILDVLDDPPPGEDLPLEDLLAFLDSATSIRTVVLRNVLHSLRGTRENQGIDSWFRYKRFKSELPLDDAGTI